MNPLFEDHPSDAMEAPAQSPPRRQRRSQSPSDDSRSNGSSCGSSAGIQSSSSGYESFAADHRAAIPAESRSPENDYRRHFVVGYGSNGEPEGRNSPLRIGRASLLHSNPQFVSRIEMPQTSLGRGLKNSRRMLPRLPEDESGWDVPDSPPLPRTDSFRRIIPQPIWPMNGFSKKKTLPAGYRTLSTVAPNVPHIANFASDESAAHVFHDKSIGSTEHVIGDSLIVWPNDMDEWKSLNLMEELAEETTSAIHASSPIYRAEELAAIGELSRTISHSHTVRTVSRALSSRSARRPTTNNTNNHDNNNNDNQWAKKKNLWNSLVGNKRHLIFNREPEDTPVLHYETLDQKYVPRNGDLNFGNSPADGRKALATFSSLTELRLMQSLSSVTSESRPFEVTLPPFRHSPFPQYPFRPDGGLEFERDRLSNASLRSYSSSSGRRVTFSADTVDNEQSSGRSSRSSISSSSIASFSELKLLNPLDLLQQYPAAEDKINAPLQTLVSSPQSIHSLDGTHGYYAYNLHMVHGDHSQVQPPRPQPQLDHR